MPKLSERQQENRFIALFVGRSGVGKTVAAASFPKPMKIEDFDGRVGGAQNIPWLDVTGIEYDYYPPKEVGLIGRINKTLEEFLNASKLGMAGVQVKIPKTHVTDSLTNQTYAFLCQAIPLTHPDNRKGKWVGITPMPGPADYGLEAQATYDYIAFLKSLPISNVIISAHYVDRYGKPPGDNNEYAESVVIGKKLSVRDKIGENVQTSFDHIFEFERIEKRFYVNFWGDIARTSYNWLPQGRHEWTGKPFYEFMMSFKKETK